MRVLLVWPNKEQFGSKPNSLSLLSAILKARGHDVRLLDTTFIDLGYTDNTSVGTRARIFKPVDFGAVDMSKQPRDLGQLCDEVVADFRPEVIGVSALSDEAPTGLELSRLFKERLPEVPIVWGNKAATLTPERILREPQVDYICVSEGIELLPELLDAIAEGRAPRDLPNLGWRDSSGRPHWNAPRPYYQKLDELPHFDYSIYDPRQLLKPFDGRAYRGGDHMIAWGCTNECTYCINRSLRDLHGESGGRFLRWYSVPRIVAELCVLAEEWDLQFFKFHDEDFCLKPVSYFRELAKLYRREVNLPFTAMANARTITREKAELLASMRCVSISLGFESGNSWLRTAVLRRRETPEELITATRLLESCGIRTSSFNMLGLPFETREMIMETVELNRESGVASPNANFFFPYEGTELHRLSVQEGFFPAVSSEVYRSDEPSLTLPALSREELIALRERFALYVKLPRDFWPFLRRSERSDAVGAQLTRALYALYEKHVLQGDQHWPVGRPAVRDLPELQRILDQGRGASSRSDDRGCAPPPQ